jgi:hypothetical protein
MNYPYVCKACEYEWDVSKRLKDIDNLEYCPECNYEGKRVLAPGYFTNEKVEDSEFCPALGQVVKSQKHRLQIAKERGLEEVGNENVAKHCDARRAEIEANQAKAYEDLATDRIVLGARS